MNDDHMTNASKPHVLCNAQKLIVNPAKTLAAACPKHRPKYLCTFGETYNRYLPGAFGLACTSTALQLEDFPRDHLQDIMESFVTLPWDAATQVTHCLRSYAHACVPDVLQHTGHQLCKHMLMHPIRTHLYQQSGAWVYIKGSAHTHAVYFLV